jgi:hypothetical protein
MIRGQATTREIGVASAIMIVLLVYLYLSTPQVPLGPPDLTFKERCLLQENFSCNSVFLRRGSSRLEILITQNTGKLINVTSLACTNGSTIPSVMPFLNNTVLITNGGRGYISGGNSGNVVVCTGGDGRSIPNASLGDAYYGNLYISYREVETGAVKLVDGTLVTRYS